MRAAMEARGGEREKAAVSRAEALAIRRRLLADSPEFAANRASLAELERQLQTPLHQRR